MSEHKLEQFLDEVGELPSLPGADLKMLQLIEYPSGCTRLCGEA